VTLEWNTSQYRALNFSDALNAAGHTGKLIHISGFMDYLSPAIQAIIAPADLVIVQRNVINQGVIDAMRYWIGLGKPMAVDLDDDYLGLPYSNPAHPFWMLNSAKLDPPPLETLSAGLHYCNALLSPNRNILRDWSHVTRGYYMPNYMRDEWWTDLPTRAEMKERLGLTDKIVIGWGGSVSHYDSWWGSGLREAAVGIARVYPQVVFLICGNDTRIFNQLDVPLANKRYHPGVQPSDWPKLVRAFDIGVAPLSGTFDQRRSWIKTMEYGLAEVPWCASEGIVYGEHAGLGQLLPCEPVQWESALRCTIEQLPTLQAKAIERAEFYRDFLMSKRIPDVVAVYREIINNFTGDHGELPEVTWVKGSNAVTPAPEPVLGDMSDLTIVSPETKPAPTPEELAMAGARYLYTLENLMPQIDFMGVELPRAFNYDLIQLCNDALLKERL